MTKQQLHEALAVLLTKFSSARDNPLLINNDNPYDAVFAANMCKADYLGSSITDEKHLCLYVKDVIDDVDGYDGIVLIVGMLICVVKEFKSIGMIVGSINNYYSL
nr:MAG TPA: hypothetical protein [Crassvirales sp.]